MSLFMCQNSRAIVRNERLSPAVKLAAMAMAAGADDDGTVRASYREIGEWSGVSLHAVWRAVQRLKDVGILTVIAGTTPAEKRTHRMEVRHG